MSDKFADLLPPLSSEEFEALKADIQANGVLHPVLVDEGGNVLDGRHRLKIDPQAKQEVVRGLSESEKAAFVYRMNFVRRNLSPDQKREARQQMRAVAGGLRRENPKKWTQTAIAAALGVTQQCVGKWFSIPITTSGNGNTGNSVAEVPTIKQASCLVSPQAGRAAVPAAPNPERPDARAKLTAITKATAVRRVKAGETQSKVASDLGVSQATISKAVKASSKPADLHRTHDRTELEHSVKGISSQIAALISTLKASRGMFLLETDRESCISQLSTARSAVLRVLSMTRK